MRRILALAAAVLAALALTACDPEPEETDEAEEIGENGEAEEADGPFAELPPRELPASIDSLARAEGWEVTDAGVLAEAGDTFTLVVPEEDVPAPPDEGQTEVVFHLDQIEADGTLVETVDIVAVTVTARGAPTETVTLPNTADAHYSLTAEVTRGDGTFIVYQDWLYAR